jgi:hypothetical protein
MLHLEAIAHTSKTVAAKPPSLESQMILGYKGKARDEKHAPQMQTFGNQPLERRPME